ncbi:MAG: GNAT family N-acetyltransferase [Hyphomicrobiales bacterium]|nr:GNAT family N-acetyltransferase [Hyphomicrobiales bacterium]
MAHLELEPLRRIGLVTPPHEPAVPGARSGKPSAPRFWRQIGDLVVDIRPLAECAEIVPQWRALAATALQPNIFYEPDFCLAAAQHLPEAAGHAALLVWDPRDEGESRLLAFWPMKGAWRAGQKGLTRGFSSRYASCGAPLLHRHFAVEAACAILSALGAEASGPAAVLFNEIALEGPVGRALRAAATLSGLTTSELGAHQRACRWLGGEDAVHDRPGPKRLKELSRQSRRLADYGDVRLLSAARPEDVRSAFEVFLGLEASGWKARRGTAILSSQRDLAFYRTLARSLARRGQMQVHLLEVGSRVAAAGVVLTSGDQAWYTKTCHDERLAAYSPGALVSHQIGEVAGAMSGLTQIDSCALPHHPMIERVWKGRMRVGDLAISLNGHGEVAVARELAARRTRLIAKRFYYQLRGWSMQGQ